MFSADTVATSTTPVQIASAIEFDRTVILNPNTGTNDTTYVGFTSTNGFNAVDGLNASDARYLQFTLPAGEDLWVWTSSGSGACSFIITK